MKETVKKIALCGACLLSAALVSAGPKPESPAAGKLVPALVVVMPSLDDGFLSALKHQQFTTTKGRYQIGVGRNFDVPVALNATGSNQWTLNADGSHSWSLQVTVDGALGARLHVENIHLPPGVSLRVFASDNPSAASPPVTAQDLGMQRDLWMQTIFSDSVTLECDAAAGADLNAVAFEVTGLSHIFEIPELNSNLKEGTCHNDVTCYQNWSAQASGVARISFVDGGNSYLCSGCLLASSVKPNANYFLTANHCIPNQGVASSVEWFWFYQTSRCNGAPPSLDSVPTTSGGGDLLAGGVSSDFSLLRVRQSVPGGAAHLVWSTATPAQNESLAGIHHPGGTFKRISFGNFYGSDSGFWAVRWRSGVTEPGSSGSPLFNANQEVIGQLNGGFNGPGSSCSNPSAPDQYGRFDVTYQSVKQWVGADPGGGGPSNLPAAGNYYGLFSDTSYGVAPESSGYARLTVNQKGHFSASLQFAAARLGFSGQFDGTGSAIVDISRGRFA
ncbi:MAG TPA: serine protease, partial [Verrucomicrobiae bacterium]|nr:serine protease [Verrucomicrobiae bacterium]